MKTKLNTQEWARKSCASQLTGLLMAVVVSFAGASAPELRAEEKQLSIAKVYWEYNASANDLGVHVFLDGEDWTKLKLINPLDVTIFNVAGRGPYAALGLTEMFFEGAEPSLDEVSLAELLALFPEGTYEFEGVTAGDEEIEGEAKFTHAIPAGPKVRADLCGRNQLVISWKAVTRPPEGFPNKPIKIAGYQVIVGSFQVTVPANVLSVTVPPEFVKSLAKGPQPYEVLAIEVGGNQTLTEGSFTKP